MAIEKRRFGRTGHMSSAVLFGAAALGKVDQGTADRVLDLLLEFGVNHIDTAPLFRFAAITFLKGRPIQLPAIKHLLFVNINERVFGRKTESSMVFKPWPPGLVHSLQALSFTPRPVFKQDVVVKKRHNTIKIVSIPSLIPLG